MALDVERANDHDHSICQVGIARVERGAVKSVFSNYIDPQQSFGHYHTRVHGIGARKVRGKPTFASMAARVRRMLERDIVISHTQADIGAINAALERAGQAPLNIQWLDSARIVRRAWPARYASGGWGLAAVAKDLEIDFVHHDAGEDARVCAEVVLAAVRESGRPLAELGQIVDKTTRRARRGGRRARAARKGRGTMARVEEPKAVGEAKLAEIMRAIAGATTLIDAPARRRMSEHEAAATERQVARLRLEAGMSDAELIDLGARVGRIDALGRSTLEALTIAEASMMDAVAKKAGKALRGAHERGTGR